MTEILMARLTDIDVAIVTHERGGLELDISAFDGLIRVSGGNTTELKSEFAQAVAPGVTDDAAAGYVVGSRWIDTTADEEFICVDSTNGAAVWVETTAGAGGGDPDQNLFSTIAGDSGSAVADGITDTITMIGGSGITTVGASTPDSVTFNLDATNTVITGLSNLVTVGALDSGSITSGFGAIDVGASSITTTGGIFGNDLTLTNDLLIATGGIINFGAGDLLLTHSTASLAITLGNLIVETLASGTAGKPAFRGSNMVDDASVLAAIFEGNRATPTAGDEAHINLRLSDSAGTQDAVARIKWTLVDETSTTEDGSLTLGVVIAGVLTDTVTFDLDGLDLVAGDAFSIAGNDVLDATTLGAAVVASSLTSVGTIATGVWEGTAVAIGFGGTGAAAKEAAFDALSPVTTEGDVIFRNATVNTRLARGTTGQVLTATATTIEWAAAGGGDALVANPLSQFAATTSLQLLGVISDETGTGLLVFGTSPTLITPLLGTPTSGVMTNVTGTASGLTAGNVTTNADLTGHITSTGNAAILGAFTVAQLSTALSDASISGNNTGDEVTASVTVSGIGELATTAEYLANTTNVRLLESNEVWDSMAEVTLTDAATVTFDTTLGNDFTLMLGGNRTLGNVTSPIIGKKGRIRVVQDGDGARTLAYGTDYEFAAGTPPVVSVGADATVTITNASPGVVTYTAHPFANGDIVTLATSGALPTGLSIDTEYFIVSQATNTFELAATKGGSSINTSSAGSGTHNACGQGQTTVYYDVISAERTLISSILDVRS